MKRNRWIVNLLLIVILVLTTIFSCSRQAQAAPCGKHVPCVILVYIPHHIFLPLVMR